MERDMSDNTHVTLMGPERVIRSLKRMAYQMAEENRDEKQVVLFGIEERGFLVAQLLGEVLEEIYGNEIPVVQCWYGRGEIKPDDRELPDSCFAVLVDDVIFSGETMFRSLVLISKRYNLDEIHTAVLVDRGHRKFPVQAQFVGMELSTKFQEHVTVKTGSDTIKKVVLELQ